MFEGIQILFHTFFFHTSCSDLCFQLIIVVDSLTACCNFQSMEQKVKTQCKFIILWIIHCIEWTFLRWIMCNKHKICIVFFFEISSDQSFFFRFQIIWIADLTIIFFGNQFLSFIKTNCWNLIYFWKLNLQDLKFFCIILLQKFHCILKKSRLHTHNVFKSIDITHFKIETGIFVQMTFRVMFFCTEYRTCFKYPVKHTHHHLFIKLWALCQYSRFVEIAEFKQVCSTLGTSCSDLRCMNFCKALLIEEITERTYQSFLNLEFRTLLNITECDRT